MKKILTWINIAAICAVDGFMQDTDTTVTLMGEHMNAIEAKLADHKVKKTEWKTKQAELEATIEANTGAATKVTELTAQVNDLNTKLTAATTLAQTQATQIDDLNAKLALRGGVGDPPGGGSAPINPKAAFRAIADKFEHNKKADEVLKRS